MDVETDERLLRNFEGYLMELVCHVENIDEVSLIADVLASVQDALGTRPKSHDPQPDPRPSTTPTKSSN
jgi:hypothetical protein